MNNNTQKFELFRCCLGNGITVCNKATTEYGDYKTIAHISDRGHIKLYVSDDYIPAEAMEIIKRDAEEQRKKFAIYWNALSLAERYGKLQQTSKILTVAFQPLRIYSK